MTAEIGIAPAASADDVAAVRALFEAYAASLSVDLAYQGFDDELAGLPGAYAPPDGALLLARDASCAACACVALRPLREPGVAEIKRLYVAPAARGRGLGRTLTQTVMAEAKRLGYRAVRLDTLPDMAAAIALYLSLGFAPVAPYYATPVEGTLFLGREL